MPQNALTSDQRLLQTFRGETADRCPVVPKIWFDLACRLTETAPRAVIEDPGLGMRTIIDASGSVGSDAARIFFLPSRKTVQEGKHLFEVGASGRRLGAIDLAGGWATHLEDAVDFSIENPRHIAYRAYRKHPAPRVLAKDDARRIAIPDRAFWAGEFDEHLRRAVAHADGRIALIGDCDSATLAWYIEFRGMEQAMYDLLEEPELVHAVMERGVEYAIVRGKFCVDHGLKILRLNDSVANMSVISPALWREFIRPHMQTVCEELHRYAPDVKIYCHICGNVLPVLEDLAGLGLDGIGPLDPLGNFSVAQARQATGPDATLMGGVNTLDFINAQPAQIFEQALRCIHEGQSAGSRFILGSGCVVPPAAKPENLLALRRASEEAGNLQKATKEDSDH